MPWEIITMGSEGSYKREIDPEIKKPTYTMVDGTIIGKCYMRYTRRQRHKFSYRNNPLYRGQRSHGHHALALRGGR